MTLCPTVLSNQVHPQISTHEHTRCTMPVCDLLLCVAPLLRVCVLHCAGEMVTRQPVIASMRVVKKETLKLISCWVSRSQDPGMVRTHTPYCTRHYCLYSVTIAKSFLLLSALEKFAYFSLLYSSVIFFTLCLCHAHPLSPQVRNNFMPPLLGAILGDYRRNVPQAREPEVLSTVTAIVDKLEVKLIVCLDLVKTPYYSPWFLARIGKF